MTAQAAAGLQDTATMARRSLLRVRRAPQTLVLSALLPLLLLLVFGYVLGGSVAVPVGGYAAFLVPGILVQAVTLTAGLGAVYVAGDVYRGMADRFRTLPVASAAVLFGTTAADLVRIAVTVAVAAVAGMVAGWRVQTGPAAAAAGFGLLLLYGYAVTWVSVLVGLHAPSPASARRMVYACLVPLTLVSAAIAPTGTMPPWLRPLAEANPVSAVAAALRALWGDGITGTGLPAYPLALAWPLVVLLVTIPLARRRHRRIAA
jgi:ABC-type multidrug transport system permease subunit